LMTFILPPVQTEPASASQLAHQPLKQKSTNA
jgi:hypothetical protein